MRKPSRKKKLKPFNEQLYFWGIISEQEAEAQLKGCESGTYLLRSIYSNKSIRIVLSIAMSVKDQKKIVHRLIFEDGRRWFLEGKKDRHHTISELIVYYTEHSISGKVKLKNFKERPKYFICSSTIDVSPSSKKLGSGNFSVVVLGKYKKRDAAVKALLSNDDALLTEKENLLKEAKMMSNLTCPYIVKFYGVAVDVLPPLMAMELMATSLLSHLKNQGESIEIGEKLSFCWQIAKGLEFMAEKKVVHRDLAARNCLISRYGIVKLTDFGLSDYEANLFAFCTISEQMPLRWAAPETILQTAMFNEKTDVWSYAVVCNEIFSNGAQPLEKLDNKAIMECLKKYDDTTPLHIPHESAPADISEMLKKCWKKVNGARPMFSELVIMCDLLLKNRYTPPSIDNVSTLKIPNVWPLTISEWEIMDEYNLESDVESEDENLKLASSRSRSCISSRMSKNKS